MDYIVGQHVQCKAVKVVPFGAFMYCPNGEELLCHISNVSDRYVANVADFVTVGEIYDCKVIIDRAGKIGLSLKHLKLQNRNTVEIRRPDLQLTKRENKSEEECGIDKLIEDWKKDYKTNVGIGDPRQLGQRSKRRNKKGSKR